MYTLILQLTEACNLKCNYCFQDDKAKEYQKKAIKSIEMNIAKKAIDLMFIEAIKKNESSIFLSFYGGEPLLEFNKLKTLTEYSLQLANKKNMGIYFGIITNGTLINKEIMDFFIKMKYKLTLSLDGLQLNHDINRFDNLGNGTYNKLINKMNLFDEYKIKTKDIIKINMVIAKNNYKDFYKNLKHIYDLGFRHMDSGIDCCDHWELEELKIIENQYNESIEFWLDRTIQKDAFRWNIIEAGMHVLYKKAKNHFCGAGVNRVFINVMGDIFPCNVCTKIQTKIGNVYTGIMEACIDRYTNYERQLSDKCKKCKIQKHCSACDCVLVNYEANDSYNDVPSHTCEMSKITYQVINNLANNKRVIIQKR